MDIIKQAKAKLKPPPPPPKPSHLSQPKPQTKPQAPSRKRGLGWPWDQPAADFPLFCTSGSRITWLFNWELWVPADTPASLSWTPCVRTAGQINDVLPFLTDIASKGRPITHFLGFNEPEIAEQANLSVDDAVRWWVDVILPAKQKLGFKLGSPGMSSDVARCVPWLDGFFDRLGGVSGGARVEFLVLHWYGPNFADMKAFLEMMHQRYGLPIWLNEFACSSMGQGEVGRADVERFLREALPWLDVTEWIERYAYFGNGQGQDVGTWVGRANNFTEAAEGREGTGGRRLTGIGKLYLEL